jgi:Mn2+/Fe2+ NRAMP family transporter
VLFVASPIAYGTILFLQRGRVVATGDRLRPWVRSVLWVLAVGYAALAFVLWFAQDASSRRAPFALVALSGRFLGCWAAFLAVLAVFSAIRGRWNEARIPLLAPALWPLGALVAALTRYGDLDSDRRVAYVAVVVVVLVVSAAMVMAGRDSRRPA